VFKTLLNDKNVMGIKTYLDQTHGYDLAQDFLLLEEADQKKLYQYIDYEQLADLVSYLDADIAANIMQAFDIEKQKEVFNYMDPDDAADIIQELEEEEQEAIIQALDKDSDVLSLINYEEDEAGSLMTNLVLELSPDMDVKQATKKVIQNAPEVETINQLFVVDVNQHFLGVVSLKDLLKAKMPLMISDLMVTSPFVYHKDSITSVISQMNQYNIYAMPVCDEQHVLLGLITLDDAFDVFEEEAQEDFEKLAALPETIKGSPLKIALHRFPWLLMLLFVSIPVSLLTNLFNDVIVAVAVIVIFQPMISGAAGNVATQALAVTLQSFANEEKDLFKNAVKEIITGLMNAIIIGIAAFLITFIFSSLQTSISIEPLKMALIVSISLVLTVFIAPIIAIIIPSSLKMMKIDPAVASGPLITTLLDMTTVFIYFSLAALLIGVV
jgi:magnesium transporter